MLLKRYCSSMGWGTCPRAYKPTLLPCTFIADTWLFCASINATIAAADKLRIASLPSHEKRPQGKAARANVAAAPESRRDSAVIVFPRPDACSHMPRGL